MSPADEAAGQTLDSASARLSHFLWSTRYRDPEASPPEATLDDTWARVARSVAAIEHDPASWSPRFLRMLQGFRFLPAGRILAGAGTARQVTLFNCFVMGLIGDSVGEIFEALKEGALTMQQGGGVGYDFSTLRPRGARARSSGVIASGPVSFMRVWDAMCATILSTGARRGAMMATLRCDHPDIEEFIGAKRASDTLQRFNLSVLITDAFMQAVRGDSDWPLVFPERGGPEHGMAPGDHNASVMRTWSGGVAPEPCRVWKVLRARELWDRLCESAYESAEPGVLFIDRINAANNLSYRETLSATNPCAEEPLPPFGACNLGSINLTAFVSHPFAPTAWVDRESLREIACLAVRFLDNVIDISRFPLLRQRTQAHLSRRIGLGVTGLADALIMLGLRYDTSEARELSASLMRTIRDAAYETSIELARERGSFPAFNVDRHLDRPFIRELPPGIRAAIGRYGIRNSHLLAIAPAGSISLLAHNLSSGIEPVFALRATRRVLDADANGREFLITDRAYALWESSCDRPAGVPGYFVEPRDIAPRDHLLMQAVLQPYVDGAISKTIALRYGAPPSSVSNIFDTAYDLGLKGFTVFREASRDSVIGELEVRTADSSRSAHCCSNERESD